MDREIESDSLLDPYIYVERESISGHACKGPHFQMSSSSHCHIGLASTSGLFIVGMVFSFACCHHSFPTEYSCRRLQDVGKQPNMSFFSDVLAVCGLFLPALYPGPTQQLLDVFQCIAALRRSEQRATQGLHMSSIDATLKVILRMHCRGFHWQAEVGGKARKMISQTNPICPWDNPGDEGRHKKCMC